MLRDSTTAERAGIRPTTRRLSETARSALVLAPTAEQSGLAPFWQTELDPAILERGVVCSVLSHDKQALVVTYSSRDSRTIGLRLALRHSQFTRDTLASGQGRVNGVVGLAAIASRKWARAFEVSDSLVWLEVPVEYSGVPIGMLFAGYPASGRRLVKRAFVTLQQAAERYSAEWMSSNESMRRRRSFESAQRLLRLDGTIADALGTGGGDRAVLDKLYRTLSDETASILEASSLVVYRAHREPSSAVRSKRDTLRPVASAGAIKRSGRAISGDDAFRSDSLVWRAYNSGTIEALHGPRSDRFFSRLLLENSEAEAAHLRAQRTWLATPIGTGLAPFGAISVSSPEWDFADSWRLDVLDRIAARFAVLAATEDHIQKATADTDDLRKRTNRLSSRVEELTQRVSAGENARTMIHNLGNLMNRVSADLGRLRKWAAKQGQGPAAFMTSLETNLERIEGELDFQRRLRNTDRSRRSYSLGNIVSDAVSFIETRARERSIAVEMRPISETVTVFCSDAELSQVFLNILHNAINALLETRGVRKISVRMAFADGRATVIIADSGAGIPSKMLTRIWEDGVTTRADRGGSGIGLAFVKRTVENLGGTVSIMSEVQRGTTVTVNLPAKTE